jgi:hypothetical protein
MATAKVRVPAFEVGVAPVEIDLKGGGTLILSKGKIDFKPKNGKNYVQRYTWSQIDKHLQAGGKKTWVPDSGEKEEILSERAKKAAETRATKKRAAKAKPSAAPLRKRA